MKKAKGFFAEFKEFISRGSVIDLAVGVIIGAAFTAIVNSLVADIVMPVIGWLLQGTDFSSFKFVITPGVPAAGNTPEIVESAIRYGKFIQNVINFILTAFVIFLLVKGINAFRRKKDEEPAPEPERAPSIVLLTEIRDLLKKGEPEI